VAGTDADYVERARMIDPEHLVERLGVTFPDAYVDEPQAYPGLGHWRHLYLGQLRGDAERIVKARWADIVKVAAALVDRRVLFEDKVLAVLR
jgi:hypothetical protein